MIKASEIPLLSFIEKNYKLPDHVFIAKRKSKVLPLIYSLLSKQYAIQLLDQKNLLINPETLLETKKHLTLNGILKAKLIEYK